MSIKICYRDRIEDFQLESNKSIDDLHEEVAKKVIPKESQKLLIKVGEEEIELKKKKIYEFPFS